MGSMACGVPVDRADNKYAAMNTNVVKLFAYRPRNLVERQQSD